MLSMKFCYNTDFQLSHDYQYINEKVVKGLVDFDL